MVTITFPLHLDDNLCYKYLNTYLTKLRKEQLINNYLWVAERQDNGTIHYHMFVSNYVNIVEYNRLMKETLLNGLNKREFQYDRRKLQNYNGVDLMKDRTTRKVINFAKSKDYKNVSKYVTKYVTKNKTSMSRQVWHCSRLLSNLATKVNITENELVTLENHIANDLKPIFENEHILFFAFKPNTETIYHKMLRYVNLTLEQCDFLTAFPENFEPSPN